MLMPYMILMTQYQKAVRVWETIQPAVLFRTLLLNVLNKTKDCTIKSAWLW